ncbi:MAG: TldD/PmbA family protein, partial [Candidatus Hydrogenedentes bacterium]|nr:TldD/PmbA family protein [Candidatus Hydrogenedentota bacterium]
MIDLSKHAEAVLMRALANGGAFAELYFEETAVTSIRFEDGKVERINSGTDAGAGIRILTGDRTCYAHTNDVSLDGLLAAADTVAGAVSEPRTSYSFEYRPVRFEMNVRKPAQSVSTTEKARLVTLAGQTARAHDPRVVQVAAVYAD